MGNTNTNTNADPDDDSGPRVTASDVRAAAERFDDDSIVQRTPVETSRSLSRTVDGDVRLKMEHLQRTGSFKPRGAYNRLQTLAARDDVEHVVAASAGNHAQGVALAARKTGLPATIVMPKNAPQTKIDATRGYGAEVVLEGIDFRAAVEHARTLADRAETEFVHAFDDPEIVAGNGTVALELVEDVPEMETVIVPIGGGGLIGGMGAALAAARPDVRLIGVQAESVATVPDSLQKGRPQSLEEGTTIADGIATGGISALTFELIDAHVDEVVTVTDEELAHGILVLLERAKQLVEGAGAAPVAALLSGRIDVADETAVAVLSGGNLDLTMLDTLLTYELTARSQHIRLEVRIRDEPGVMQELSGIIAELGANIRAVDHVRSDDRLDVGQAFLEFVVETSGRGHADAIREQITEHGYEVERVN
ncbi:threonine ammonia-lyase [Halobacteria archaeon AArc-m2/3/4]|uniref:threonine ammonia-lyase n=1 Tax=Natronoglomus mannanivorans TaxID=2979990 RepID=A0ABT2QFT0_9EURY|nr:threonine ammonia-lyase [Halobacteria archaeon AArc-m2/3/4]